MNVTKAIVIKEPWIGLILDGSKSWEMRAQNASFRGWIGLIGKGTGAVCGVARLVHVGAPLSAEQMIAHQDKHCIPAEMISSGEVAKWNRPWVLANATRLSRPVPYRHKSGAVTWVTLDSEVSALIARQVDLREPAQGG